jgi:hypothetical protein
MKTLGSDGAGRRDDRPAVFEKRSVTIRPGVEIPDWSVVEDTTARQALAAIFDLVGAGRKWNGTGATQDRVRRTVIQLYATLGRAPVLSEIADGAGLPPEAVADELPKLGERDAIVLDPAGQIVGAYPFTERRTGHRVSLGDRTLNAMCAIDALGTGAMLDIDTRITSSCRHCGAAVDVSTRAAGTDLALVTPQSAIVWIGMFHAGGCSATSLCTVLNFFCSDDHLAAWRRGAGQGQAGYRLSMAAALQVGRAIFSPILRPAVASSGRVAP